MVIEAFVYDGFEYVLTELTVDPLGNETAVYARADGHRVIMNRSREEKALHDLLFGEDMSHYSVGEV